MLTGRETEFSDLGIRDYRKVWEMQQQVLEEVKQRKMQGKAVPGYLFFVEHPPVYTLGKSGKEAKYAHGCLTVASKMRRVYKGGQGW